MKNILTIFDVPSSQPQIEPISEPESQIGAKKKRGRPSKNVVQSQPQVESITEPELQIDAKKKRGRPSKNVVIENNTSFYEKITEKNINIEVGVIKKSPSQLFLEKLDAKEYETNKKLFYLLTTFSCDYYIVSYDEYKQSYIGYPILKSGTEKDCILEKNKKIAYKSQREKEKQEEETEELKDSKPTKLKNSKKQHKQNESKV